MYKPRGFAASANAERLWFHGDPVGILHSIRARDIDFSVNTTGSLGREVLMLLRNEQVRLYHNEKWVFIYSGLYPRIPYGM